MNISQMMGSFLGEASAQESRAMELKVGQIVRGVILQVMENNEALVQINGVQVRAKLEMMLQAGQTAMLQVQPQSNGALIMLKQIEPNAVGLPDDTFKEWAKQLALPEQKWAVEIVKDLRKDGFILNREVAQSFQQAAASLPSGGDVEQWMQAAAATFKRGLPMTGSTVGAMQQVMFGKSAHELLAALGAQLASAAAGQSDGQTSAKPLSQAAVNVQQLLTQGAELLRNVTGGGELSTALGASSKQTGVLPMGVNGTTIRPETMSAVAGNTAQAAETDIPEPVTSQGGGRTAAVQPNWIGQMMKWLGVDYEHQLAKAVTAEPQQQQLAQLSNQKTEELPAGASARSSAAVVQSEADASSAKGQPALAAQGNTSDTDGQQPLRHQEVRHLLDRAPLVTGSHLALNPDGSAAPEASPLSQQDSLKSALLTLMSADDTPPAIKETAQQLVQQITGQQLLLTPERNNSMMTHVTMYIPINNEDGNQTASVHIQTRRGRKGELDSSNCRLLFNLSMKTLGNTMVDVNVMDKIVSLNLWNDHPAIGLLAESSRSEIADSLQAAGYQLLSLRTTPLPKAGEQVTMESSAAAARISTPPDLSQFSSTRYKGVDYRI